MTDETSSTGSLAVCQPVHRTAWSRLLNELHLVWKFFSSGLKDLERIGSLVPSSRFLARAMLAPLPLHAARIIVELGPGTGPLTKALLRAMRADAVLYALELDDVLHQALSRSTADPRLHAIHADAVALREVLRERGVVQPVTAIASSLALSMMPDEVRDDILSTVVDTMAPDGVFTQFSYVHTGLLVVKASGLSRFHARRFLSRYFEEVETRVVLRNAPPAVVYRCRGPKRRAGSSR